MTECFLGVSTMFSHGALEFLSWSVVILGFVAIGAAALGTFKKSVYENLEKSIGYSKQLAELANANSDAVNKRMSELIAGQELNAQRITRLEIDNARKSRQLASSRTEIDKLENIVRVAVSALHRLSPEQTAQDQQNIEKLLLDLTQTRNQSQKELQEWEETQSIIHVYMGDHTAPILERRKG